MIMRTLATLLVAATLLATAGMAAPQPTPFVLSYLTTAAGFTRAEVDSLESGQVLAKVVSNDQDAELAVVGAVRIRASRSFVLQYYNEMIRYIDGKVTLQYGKFSNPPAPADVASLTLEPGDIETLKSCKPGDCDLKLGARGIEAARSAIGFQQAGYADRANAFVRKAIVDYVNGYLSRGDAALVTYDDRSKPVSLAAQFRGILANSPHFPTYAPALKAHLESYPRGAALRGGQDSFYWLKENWGQKPTISIVHMVTYDDPQKPGQTMVAQKQIYASHYLEGSLAVAAVVELEAGTGGNGLSYLLYANRSRGDMLRGGFGGLKRTIARDQARKGAIDTLGTIQEQLELALKLR